MMKNNRNARKVLTVLLVTAMLLSSISPAAAAVKDDTIVIRSTEDLLKLAKNCSLDSWSQNKNVVLACDISLKGVEFLPIPTFGGSFDGQGHTISGLELAGSAAPTGLFGILQENASVQNLHVSGVLTPSGEQTEVGGICGENYGTIQDSSFEGLIAGEKNIGGIAGMNGLTGKIQSCIVQGKVTGEKRTGGIAGYNLGTVSDCINKSHVNTDSTDPSLELKDFLSLEELLRLTAEETYNIATDTGGICGYSSGMILSCTNEGTAGYVHIGYNVGGIAGRSSGHISSCTNTGTVYGRKDVGGITGQVEPYIILKVSDDLLQNLQREMKTLNSMVNGVADNLEKSSAVLSAHMENLHEGISTAGQLTGVLAGSLAETGEENIAEINRAGEIMQAGAAQLETIAQQGVYVAVSLAYAMQQLELAVEEMQNLSVLGTETLRQVNEAVKDLNRGQKDFAAGTELVSQGIASLKAAFSEDPKATDEALQSIWKGLKQMNQGMNAMEDALKALRTALKGEEILTDEVDAALKAAEEALKTQGDALKLMADGAAEVIRQAELNLEKLEEAFVTIQKGASRFEAAGQDLDAAMKDLAAALNTMKAASAQMTAVLDQLADAAGGFRSVAWTLAGMMGEVEELFAYLASADPVQIAPSNQETALSAGALYGTVAGLEEELHAMTGSVTSMTKDVADSVRKINNQFMVVMDTLMTAVYSVQDEGSSLLEDTSSQDIDSITSGKVYAAENRGMVCGDVNVGGITGTMAVESELDPEDDLKQLTSGGMQQTYELKCILQRCVNNGKVTARKNCAGGITGKMDLGLITSCENYGTVSSETGNYAGGIAGSASSAIRSSFAKSFLSGTSYVGGIAGIIPEGEKGSVKNCCSMVEILSCQQYGGAICGDDNGVFSKNYFVSDALAGLNRVSLEGKAEPVSYRKLQKMKKLPAEFQTFTLTFMDGETVLKTLQFDYGESFGDSVFPDIPEKEGYYGVWSREKLKKLQMDTVVKVSYQRYHTALESFAQREDGRPVFFVEGQFLSGDHLAAAQESMEADDAGLVTEEWSLQFPEDGQETHMIRYLKPVGQDGEPTVYVLDNGKWKKAVLETFGSYVIFETEGSNLQVRTEIPAHSSTFQMASFIGIAVLAAAAVLLAVLLIRKRKI